MKQYTVDAFTNQLFRGNQAAICVLDAWLPEALMMDITRENNFSETAFTVRNGAVYELRLFTPGGEIDLCGHATLACAYVLLNEYLAGQDCVTFATMSGNLTVKRQGSRYEMVFPSYDLKSVPVTDEMAEAFGAVPSEAYLGRDLLCVFEDENIVCNLKPDQERLRTLDGLIAHATAPGADYDCVSRSFAPKLDIEEDPVCGSGHCHIIPYWAQRLGKRDLKAYQASKRGGTLYCRVEGDRTHLAGEAVLFSVSELKL